MTRWTALAAVCGFTFCGSAWASTTYHVSVVEKNSVNHFYNRLATDEHHVVVTKDPVPNALESTTVTVADDQTLVLIEPHDGRMDLPGEVARLDGLAITVRDAKSSRHIHGASEPLDYLERVAPAEQVAAPFKARSLLGRDSDAPRQITIDPAYLKDKLAALSGARAVEINGKSETIRERQSAEGKRLARAFLTQEYKALGYTVTEHKYGRGTNLIAERAGEDSSRVLVVSAHYDSAGNAGADDDGSGVISGLAVAQALRDVPLTHSLRFVAFDEEESGLVGSKAYANELKNSDRLGELIGLVNVEMTGYDADADGGFHVIDCNENTSAELTSEVMDAVERASLPLKKVSACTNRSDHAAFWRHNVPAIVISQNFFGGDSNPCYHRSCDRIDRVNFEYMANITKAVGGAVSGLVAR